MAKSSSVFVCTSCGAQTRQFFGKCSSCGSWNSLVEQLQTAAPAADSRRRRPVANPAEAGAGQPKRSEPIQSVGERPLQRLATGYGEFDRVLGGGLVPGSLVLLGLVSGLLGRIYGQIPGLIPTVVAVLALLMGLNLLGLLKLPLPAGPDPEIWRRRVPAPLAPIAAGLAFGLAATPCTTPVLAVLLAWMAQNGKPLVGMLLLTSFGAGQVVPLLLAGTAAASLPGLLSLRRLGQWVPPISGVVLVTTGALTLVANWR